MVPTQKGEKRMKLLSLEVKNGEEDKNKNIDKLVLITVHIEGKDPGLWNDVKNSIVE